VGVARTVCCALVVLAHVNIYTRAGMETWWPGGIWIAPFLSLAVPTFLVASGYFTPIVSVHTRPGFYCARRRLSHLLPPLVFWSVVLLALGYGGPKPDWLTLLDIATGPGHLYYLFVLTQSVLVAPLLSERRLGWLFASAAMFSVLSYVASDALLWKQGGDEGATERFLAKLVFTWSLFLVTGFVVRQRPDLLEGLRREMHWLVVVVAVLYFAYSWELQVEEQWLGYHPRQSLLVLGLPFQWLGSLLLLLVLDGAAGKPSWHWLLNPLSRAARFTYAVYLAHLPAILVLFYVTNTVGLPTTHWVFVPLLGVSAWTLSWILWKLVRLARPMAFRQLVFGTTARGLRKRLS
jgi:surface polysaccharide O-acyltransferase-like enzyme